MHEGTQNRRVKYQENWCIVRFPIVRGRRVGKGSKTEARVSIQARVVHFGIEKRTRKFCRPRGEGVEKERETLGRASRPSRFSPSTGQFLYTTVSSLLAQTEEKGPNSLERLLSSPAAARFAFKEHIQTASQLSARAPPLSFRQESFDNPHFTAFPEHPIYPHPSTPPAS